MIMPPGAFFTLGVVIMVRNYMQVKSLEAKKGGNK